MCNDHVNICAECIIHGSDINKTKFKKMLTMVFMFNCKRPNYLVQWNPG